MYFIHNYVIFLRNMKKAFYASAFIFEALKVFGEVSDEVYHIIVFVSVCARVSACVCLCLCVSCAHDVSVSLQVEEKRKYAKWKAVDIDKCLKNGITPTPGPPGGDDSNLGLGSGPPSGMGSGPPPGGIWIGYPGGDLNQNLQPGGSDLNPSGYNPSSSGYNPSSSGYNPSSSGYNPSSGGYSQDHIQPIPKPRSIPPSEPQSVSSNTSSGLTPEQLERVTKLCKFAISSLDYEDKDGAIENLTKALNLLKTGKE